MKRDKYLFYIIILITFLLFFFRLLDLQVVDKSYRLMADENSKMTINIFPDRGFIYDRNGKLLVSNRYIYDIIVDREYIDFIDSTIFLKSIDLPREYISKRINNARKSLSKKIVLFKNISEKEYGFLKEFIFRTKGIYVEKRNDRHYHTNSCANVLGYTGGITSDMLKKDDFYEGGNVVGITGVEKSYEKYLRGEKGVEYFYTNSKRNQKEPYENGEYNVNPIRGKSVTLTIDSDLQEYAEKLMMGKRGSVVAIEPGTGEILILASSPTYSPELLTGRNKRQNYLFLENQENLPLYDRSVLAEYPPGSPFKIITGLIALQEKRITEYTTNVCNHGYRLSHNKVIACKCGTGSTPINIVTAIEKSCNTFFIKSYKKSLEIYENVSDSYLEWYNYVTSFGLNSYYNNDIFTGRKGYIPNISFYDKIYGKNRWYSTFTLSNAIGQGEILMTPLQMANLAAIVSNRGYYYIPHVGKSIDSDNINDNFFVRKYTNVDNEKFDIMIRGMRKVMLSGSARWGNIENISICGKTGTAQNTQHKGKDHALFIAFAPMENPKIAISVIVENSGFGATWAVPIASLVIEKYLNKEVKRKGLEGYIINTNIEK